MAKRYHVSDGKLLLALTPDEDGWFTVTSPIDPAMITQARTIEEAFAMARDAFSLLAESRADGDRWTRPASKRRPSPRRQRAAGAGI